MKYPRVFVAGTFDGIHKGHEALLNRAFKEGGSVTIGLTSDAFIGKFKSDQLAQFAQRKQALELWLAKYPRRPTIIAIDDVHEPAASMPELDAIVVSTVTAFRAREINDIRESRGLNALAILEVPMVNAQDKKPISSTRMRNGHIDRDGRLVMPDNLRPELAKPLGRVLSGQEIKQSIDTHRGAIVITVGDVATETLIKHELTPSLAIIDQKVARVPHDTLARIPKTLLRARISAKSGPGYIAKEVEEIIANWSKKPERTLLIIEGEEDLLALPAIVYAPVGSVVYYGQPEQALWACGPMAKAGLVEVIISQEKIETSRSILQQFMIQ